MTDAESALRAAANEGDLAGVKLLVTAVIDINSVGAKTGQTALHRAVKNKHTAVVEFLIAQGIDPTIEDGKGNTAVFYAKDDANLQRFFSCSCSERATTASFYL